MAADIFFRVLLDTTDVDQASTRLQGIRNLLQRINNDDKALAAGTAFQEFNDQAGALQQRLVRIRDLFQQVQKVQSGQQVPPKVRKGIVGVGLGDPGSLFQSPEQLQRLRAELQRLGQATRQELDTFVGQANQLTRELSEQFIQGLPLLEQTLVQAFQGFSRRFRATLQFAISGALIFSLQRLVREAFETAVEVERAFADIGTALEFDIAAARGTAEFRRALEDIRIGVLQAADEFNVLPTVANEVAFTMVSRFRDAENAISATRSQIIALKVSTIDADEILRSLTATAEAFALETANLNETLSLQERVLRREQAAVEVYQTALDLATKVQQEWGVQLEDTIEGTGRAAEVFRQLGFSIEQTAAIVSSTVFQLGLTGTNVAERLNRSIGQITSPQIRQDLLDLAAASEEFTLTFADFESGAVALEALSSQFERLQRLEPETARRIAQVVGQRRETEVVSAVLANRDFQRQIVGSADEAAGAAERRFDILQETTAEKISSIAQQFQELAQNLERLGAISPFKLILDGANQFLNIINELLKQLNSFRLFLSGIPGVGLFANILPDVIALGLALKTIRRTLKAIGTLQVFQEIGSAFQVARVSAAQRGKQLDLLARSGAVEAAAGQPPGALGVLFANLAPRMRKFGEAIDKVARGLLTGFLTALRAVTVNLAANAKALFTNTVALIRNAATGTGAGLLGRARGAIQGFFNLPGVRSTAFLGGLVAAGALINSFASGASRAEQEMERYRNTLQDLNRETDRRLALEQITPFEADVERAENVQRALGDVQQLTGFEAASQNVAKFFPGLVEAFNDEFAKLADDPDQIARLLELEGVDTAFGQAIAKIFPVGEGRVLIPASEENIQARLADLFQTDLGRAQARALRQQVIDVQGLLPEDQALGLTRQISAFLLRLRQADTAEEILALRDEWADLESNTLQMLQAAGVTAQALEETINTFSQRFEDIRFGVQFGRSPTSGAADLEKLRQEIETQADAIRKAFPDDAQQLDELARQALIQQSQFITQSFDQRRELAGLVSEEDQALIQQIELFRAEIRQQAAIGNFAAVRQARIGIIQAQRSLVEFYANQAREESGFREEFARTIDERIESQRELAAELRNLAASALARGVLTGNAALIADAKRLAEEAGRIAVGVGRLVEERDIRELVARTRANGPVLSELTRINADLKGARERLSRLPANSVEALETINEINELIAAQAQELFRRAAAQTQLNAGVNDELADLRAQIAITSQEMELTAELFGKQSSEFLELKLRQRELQFALLQAQLELRDVNRRLDTDITNSFEQAQLDLVQIMEKLAVPDLGELEKARLELEKKNAEANARRAFFSDRLFQLRFSFETGEIGTGAYIGALERLLQEVDTSTQQGKEIFLEIQGIIDGLTDDVNDLAFNIPESIRLPTIFEVRRALAADQLGVNYQDNRQQDIRLFVSDNVDVNEVINAIEQAFGTSIDLEAQRLAQGGAGITIGGFN